ncbi:methyltransferase domain-containing protein [Pseudodesulfovibrio sp. JC047]|uniref:class I SAM-dependent methyltransferase n=1 Tax=Pseudodesulfovibrio sp. JC047 TaxID=2683199 RepID=UPI0013D022F6|nr:class I SAM-dependent methyltransferase [Pseudodesulfovibrio sp. JC047]NDV18851.1 methyltransferase domain-containing protein [Pseudodesulfovibrio sp. JC047]
MNSTDTSREIHVMSWRKQWTLNNPVRGMLQSPNKMFGHLVEPGMQVVDTGCGTGFFSLALARMVGRTGTVTAVDLQAEALEVLQDKARQAGLNHIIKTRHCEAHDIGDLPKADFALAAYMVHEVPDVTRYFERMAACVKQHCLMVVVEPKFHVSTADFQKEIDVAIKAGFELEALPAIFMSRAAVLTKN